MHHKVLFFTLLALPIVLPPAILICVALLVSFLVEALVWIPLKVGELTARALRPTQEHKQVNGPHLEWRS
jgi:hypothetical protein